MISIITPVYNVEEYVSQCIESILNQEYQDWEWILVDDGSKDNSLNIIREYEKRDKRIRVLTQINQGPAAARNLALKYAMGDYITFLDSDDWMVDSALLVIHDIIDKYQPDMVMWNFKRFTKGQYTLGNYPMPKEGYHDFDSVQKYAADFVFEYKKRKGQYFPSCWIRAFRAEIIQKNGLGFNPKLKRTEDYIFLAEAHSMLNNMYVISDPLTVYRANEGSITHNYTEGYMDMIDEIYDKILSLNLNVEHDELVRRADLMYIYRAFVAFEQEIRHSNSLGQKLKNIGSISGKRKTIECIRRITSIGEAVFGKKYHLLKLRIPLLIYAYYRIQRRMGY